VVAKKHVADFADIIIAGATRAAMVHRFTVMVPKKKLMFMIGESTIYSYVEISTAEIRRRPEILSASQTTKKISTILFTSLRGINLQAKRVKQLTETP